MTNKTYAVFFILPDDLVSAIIDWNRGGESSLERVHGEWVPLDEEGFESLNGLAVATMSEEVIKIFDKAEEDERSVNRSEILDYVVKLEKQ